MKHRDTFFIHSQNQSSTESLGFIQGENGEASTLKIRNLKAAREWKITVNYSDLDERVRILIKERNDKSRN